MPRPPAAVKPIVKELRLPPDIVARTDLILYSHLENRVPYGAWAKLLTGLLEEWLQKVEQGGNHG